MGHWKKSEFSKNCISTYTVYSQLKYFFEKFQTTASSEVICYFDQMALYPMFENFRRVLEDDEGVVVKDCSSYSSEHTQRGPNEFSIMVLFILIEGLA